MKKLSFVFIALVALLGSMLQLSAAESETFTGIAARTGTYKRPLLLVGGKRYELKASDKADASVAEMLAKLSKGNTGTYVVKGTQSTVNGNDGILIDSIAPAVNPLPSTGAAAPATNAVQGHGRPAAAKTTPTVALAGNGTILQSFPGGSGPGYKPTPDTTGAVGPNHVVDFEDSWFMVHDKASGQVVRQLSMSNFWVWVQPSNTFVLVKPNDPRMLYDTLSGRWFASCADDATQHRLYLAVSTSSDPTQPWKGLQTPFRSPDFGFRMGVDKNGFYGCWWNFQHTTGNSHIMMDGCAIPKADMLAPGGPDLRHVNLFTNFEVESFPATDLNPNKALSDPEIFLCKQFPTDTKTGPITRLCMYKITWSSPVTASLSAAQFIPLSRTYWGPNGASGNNLARQPAPGGALRADEGRRTIGVFAFGGRVLGCNGAKDTLSSRPGILWYDVRVSDGALLQEGFVDDPICDYTHPSLAVDAAGNIGLGCTRTSTNEYPSVCIMMHAAADPAGTMRPAVKAVPGTTYFRSAKYKVLPWGNYSTTCIDPSDPKRLWTYQEYANSPTDGQWCTAWASFQLAPTQ